MFDGNAFNFDQIFGLEAHRHKSTPAPRLQLSMRYWKDTTGPYLPMVRHRW